MLESHTTTAGSDAKSMNDISYAKDGSPSYFIVRPNDLNAITL